jgi:hypothetical protein
VSSLRSQEHILIGSGSPLPALPRGRLRTATLGRNPALIVGALILCVLIPGLLLDWQVTGAVGVKGSVPLQIMITAWAGLRLAKLWARGEPRPFAIIFWLYVYVWIGLSGLVQMISQTTPWLIPISSSAVWQSQVIVIVGLALLEVGHLFPTRTKPQHVVGRQIVDSRVTILVVVSLVTAPIWFHVVGGFHALFSSRQELKTAIFGGNTSEPNQVGVGIKTVFSTIPIFMALYVVIVTRKYSLSQKRSRVALALLVVATFILNSPITMPRFWVATILIALIFALPRVQKKPSGTRMVIIGALLVSIALFPYAAYFRRSTGFKQPPGVVQTLETKGDYDSFEMITAGVQYTFEDGFRYGSHALGDILFFVPRSIWPSKAEDTGAFIGHHFHLSYTNLSAPLWIEGYIDFGYVGVIAIFFSYGMIMRRGDDRFVRGDSPFAQFLIPLMAGYTGILLRGPMLQAMARLAGMLVIAWLISKRGEPRPGVTAIDASTHEGGSVGQVARPVVVDSL